MAFAATGAEGDVHTGELEGRFHDGFLVRLGFLETDTELFTDVLKPAPSAVVTVVRALPLRLQNVLQKPTCSAGGFLRMLLRVFVLAAVGQEAETTDLHEA